ncbi:hypothetical protein V6N11_078849 [Hibiscus sabdariffa]|uniref:Uncharacterized protein n=1 Tax=Hibiscus sabdariffa TaxID=183260 RepID=A0ABR2RTX2_9ROSI
MHDYELPRNFNFKGLSLIDVTSEDDCLINSPLNSGCFDEYGKLDGKTEEGESRGNGRQKLHKSVSWDSSFFGTQAFLEPEEFSGREDVNRPRCSLTMLHGEASRQGNLKADFDDDIRASIQKSKRVPGIGIGIGHAGSSVKKELETKDSRAVSSSKKLDNSNHDKVKQKATAPKKLNIASKEPGKTMKQSVGRSGVSTSSLHKSPRLMDRRASLSAKDAKSATGRRTTISKTPALDGSRNAVTRTTLSSRSSSMYMIKQNKDSSLVNSSSSGYTTTSASKSAAEGKSQAAGRSAVSTLLKSPIKLHSSMSVAASYRDSSSVSSLSSSTTTATKRPNVVRASLGSGSHKGLVTDNDARQVSDFHCRHSLGGGAEDTGSVDGSTELHPAVIKHSGLRQPSSKPSSSNGLRSRHNRTQSVLYLTGAPNETPKNGAKSTNTSGGSNKATPRTLQQSTSAARKVRSASRNPKISPGMPPKLENKPSQKTGRESYSKAQGIGSAEKVAGSAKPKLVAKPRGKGGARIKDAKVVPLAVPDH